MSLMETSIIRIWWSESKKESSLDAVLQMEFLNLSCTRQKSRVEQRSEVHGGAKWGVAGFLYV